MASAASWVVLARLGMRLLRLGSNLILTRLLFPEAFGLVAIVYALLDGLQMFSDLGVGPSVIQDRRGRDPAFLDTAWTVQVARGVVLWAIAASVAWPLAAFYGADLLAPLIVVAGFSAVLRGLQSMSFFLLQRDLSARKLAAIEAGGEAIGSLATIAIVWAERSVWGLVIGSLVGVASRTLFSHLVTESPSHRLRWEPAARRSLYRFGRWIVLATPFTFLWNQGDRLVLGRFFSLEQLGLFAIASLLVKSLQTLNDQVTGRVLLPVYAEVGKVATPGVRKRVERIRLVLMGVFLPPLWALAIAGGRVIELLYDDRYEGAGWMLEILAAGTAVRVASRVGPIHLARGESHVGLFASAAPAVFFLATAAVLWPMAGERGLVIALAGTYAFHLPVEMAVARRYGIWLPRCDALGVASTLAVIGAGWLLRS